MVLEEDFSPFLEVLCKSSGKLRRFARNTDSQFALQLINGKLGVGAPLGSYIEAVKEGEEPINFGPKSILIDYGNGWKLQTATTEGLEKKNDVESNQLTSERFPTNGGFEENSVEPLTEQFCIDEGFEKENGVELILDPVSTYECFGMKHGAEPTLKKLPAGPRKRHVSISSSEKLPDVITYPTLPTPEPISMIQANYGSDGEESRVGDCPTTTDAFTTTTIFAEREELIDWCKNAGRSIGVVIVIGKSDRVASGRRPRVILTCERSGVFRPKKSKDTNTDSVSRKCRRRDIETKKCDCPFRLKGCLRYEGGWELKVLCGTHNHSLGGSFTGHSTDGRLAPEEQELLIELSKAGAKPREILNALKKRNPNNASTKSTIYNYRRKIKF